MHIIDTVRKAKGTPRLRSGQERQKAKLKFKTQNFAFWFAILIFGLNLQAGLAQNNNPQETQDYAAKADSYYEAAVAQYEGLIAKGGDKDKLYFELGRLYYQHGELEKAIDALGRSGQKQAKGLLAIAYYRAGNFTDALEVFKKNKTDDEECRYYYALTCEKLNLFDKALEIYKEIKGPAFGLKAGERAQIIERRATAAQIKDIDPQAYKIISAAPPQAQYPQAGALILYCGEKTEITPQNTEVSSLHYIIKILNERGKEEFSESEIDYDSTYEKVVLEYARTIKPDGTVQDVGSRHIRDVSRYLNFPLYSNARVYIISFPEIAEGSVIEYKVKVYRNELVNKKDFDSVYPVQSSEPVIAANFTFSAPKGRAARIKILNKEYNNFGAALDPVIKDEGGNTVYSWQFRNIPQIIPEPTMPPESRINPMIIVSSFDSWQDIYNWWRGLSKDKISADSAIKDKVRQLVKGKKEPEEKIRAIYNFCAQKIRYVAVEYGQAGYEPHKAGDVFGNKYGDCKDQAILLVTMLKEAGFSAWPVLIATREYLDLNEDLPAVLFNHCIAAVSVKGGIVFLDPTAETCSFGDLPAGDQGRKVLLISETGYRIESTPVYPAEHNLIVQRLKIKIDNDESISAERDVNTYGSYDQMQRYWLLYTPPELVEQSLKEKIQSVSIGATLEKYDIKNLDNLNEPIALNYNFKGPEYFIFAGPLRIMPALGGVDTSIVAKDRRKYPMDFGILDVKENIFEIDLPDTFAIKYLPETINAQNQWLEVSAEYKPQGRTILSSQRIKFKKEIVSQQEYAEFKGFIEGLAKQLKQRIVLEKVR